jgi:hypothetical protein
MLHLINYNVLIDFLVPIHPSRAMFTYNKRRTFVKHMYVYQIRYGPVAKYTPEGYIFFGSPSPGRPEFESWTLFGVKTGKQQSCERGRGRSAPLWVLVSIKRRVCAAHGRVARLKPTSHIYNRKEFISEPFFAWGLASISIFTFFPKNQQKHATMSS